MPKIRTPVCSDCGWLETRTSADGRPARFCVKHGVARAGAELSARACSDFRPLETTGVLPAQPPLPPPSRPLAPPPLFQPPDPDGFRAFLRDEKDFSLRSKLMTEREAVKRFIHSGDYVGFELYGTVRCPLSVVREIVRRRVGGLRLMGQGLMDADFLIAAGLVAEMDITYVGYEAYGLSPILRRAVESGALKLAEWSNAAITWRMKAAAMGLPFLPARTMLGTDTLARSPAKTMQDPFTGMELTLLPALVLDAAVIHVHRADKFGNCQIDGISGFAVEMSRACRRLIVSAEEIVDTEAFREKPERTVIPYFLVDAVVPAPFGAHPGETCGVYRRDEPHIKEYLEATRSEEATRRYLDEFVHGVKDHAAYLERVGASRLRALKVRKNER
ncbi:MAG: CoA transferase subunit A [Elusimicrobia bacterium]|nr:CoA transferase subunit A [Elusimicrobiota bacterium]